ncbi:MAG TPA: acetate/propionate family kinase [Bryobacteraceae bacterium]|jgi:acetate kinase
MPDYAFVLNAGSSSLKFCVFGRSDAEPWHLKSRGQIEGIGTSPRISAKAADGGILIDRRAEGDVRSYQDAINALGAWFKLMYEGGQVVGVGHRVVHGGARFTGPTVITPQVMAELRSLIPLAPLHQPYNLAAIEAVAERLPTVPQVACFDTSFHRGQPPVAELVPLPLELRRGGVQRYGFHGLSYEYIASTLPQIAPEIARGRVIVAHLGSGASLCALKDGKSIDCTFGFTALDGLCMGTRPGSIDPGVILYLLQTLNLSAKEIETILYKKSGLLGISGISNDVRDLEGSSEPAARLALDYFVYRAAKEIGALAAVLGGIDGLVFTAGIGENSAEMRRRICESSVWLGIELDAKANSRKGPCISTRGSKVSTWVIPTNEELMIAQHTGELLNLVDARV